MKFRRIVHAPGIVEQVIETDEDFHISLHDTSGFRLLKSLIGDYVPKRGDEIQTIHDGTASIIGAYVNGSLLYEKTEAQVEKERFEASEKYRKKAEAKFKANKPRLDALYENLPDVFQRRIDRFRKNCKDFRILYEDYEMSVCESANFTARVFDTAEELCAFLKVEGNQEIFEGRLRSAGYLADQFVFSLANHYLWDLAGKVYPEEEHNPKKRGDYDPSYVVMHVAASSYTLVGSRIFDGLEEEPDDW